MISPTTHRIKSWAMFFEDIASGKRTSDIRSTKDRRFFVGDFLELLEFDPVSFTYTGRFQVVEITYIQQNKSNPCAISRDALRDDYAVLSIKKLEAPGVVRVRNKFGLETEPVQVASDTPDVIITKTYPTVLPINPNPLKEFDREAFIKEMEERNKKSTSPFDINKVPPLRPTYVPNKGWDGD